MKKLIRPLIVMLVVTLVALLATGLFVTRSTRSRVTSLRQEIKQKGDPLYLVDFRAEPIEEDSNFYFHLMNAKEDIVAFDEFLQKSFNGWTGADFRDPKNLAKSDIDTLTKGIDDHKELFAQIDRMANCQQYQADLDFEKGLLVLLHHLTLCKSLTSILEAKTTSDVSQQKGDEAIRNCIRGLRISRLLMNEPILISFLSALAMERKMLDDAFFVISTTPTSLDARADLNREISNSNRKSGMVLALKGERSCGIQTFRDLREGNDNALGGMRVSNQILGFAFKQAYLNDDESQYITVMNNAIKTADKSHAERVRLSEEIINKLEGSTLRFSVTKLILPATLATTEAVDFNTAKARSLQVILRLQTEGQVTLNDLPQDPFSRKPLITKQKDQAWTVYSVGKNQKDDHGDLGTPKQNALQAPDVGYGPIHVVSSGGNAN